MRRRRLVAAVSAVGALVAGGVALPSATAIEPVGIDLQPASVQQKIDGFGYSAAFQRTGRLNLLSDEKKAEAVELLLGDSGVNPSILRLGIGGQSTAPYDWMLSIQPTDPGGPDAEPNYQWDSDDNGQVWFAQAAEAAGVEYIYGNAWTAPGYMKTNGDAASGGTLCGLSGTDCASGDWTEAYANYLVAWADFYKQEGVGIDGIAFTNEPDFTSTYESMRFTPAQAAEFTKTFGPIADEAGYDVVCCESFGWNQGKSYHSAIRGDSEASKWVDVLTAHSYASRSDTPFETDGSLWMSEYAVYTPVFNNDWDGDPGNGSDGLQMADHMIDSLTKANATGYLWWLGVSQGSSASLIVVDVDNDTYTVSPRLYGMAAFSRFIRPNAVRFDAVHSVPDLKVAAFDNADGTRVVQLLNNGAAPISTDIDLDVQPTAYLNDQSHRLEQVEGIATTSEGKTDLELPARSLVTLVVEGEGGGTGPQIDVTADARCLAGSAYVAVRAHNIGASPADTHLVTPYGERTFDGVQPGRSAYQSFATRSDGVAGGAVRVTAVDAAGSTSVLEASYEGLDCGG